MLKRLTLSGFRGFDHLELDLEKDITVLVGPNGAGKTAVLDAIALLLASDGFKPEDVRIGSPSATVIVDYSAMSSPDTQFRMGYVAGSNPESLGVQIGRHVFGLYYGVARHVRDETPGSTSSQSWGEQQARFEALKAAASYKAFFHWMRETEDRENEQVRYDGAQANPQLAAVRGCVEMLIPGVRNLRIRREGAMGVDRPRLTVEKEGTSKPLILDALSEGERTLIAMVADMARRLVLFYARTDSPLEQPAVILIDEIEQHLHPGLQRVVVNKLRAAFPGAQFIATTQSPIVVSEIEPRCLRLLRDFELVETTEHRAGLDVNEILEGTFDTPRRREREELLLDELKDSIDDDELDKASALLDKLEDSLGELDREVVFHRTLIKRLERS